MQDACMRLKLDCASMLPFALAALAVVTLATSDVNTNPRHGLHSPDGQPTPSAVELGAAQHMHADTQDMPVLPKPAAATDPAERDSASPSSDLMPTDNTAPTGGALGDAYYQAYVGAWAQASVTHHDTGTGHRDALGTGTSHPCEPPPAPPPPSATRRDPVVTLSPNAAAELAAELAATHATTGTPTRARKCWWCGAAGVDASHAAAYHYTLADAHRRRRRPPAAEGVVGFNAAPTRSAPPPPAVLPNLGEWAFLTRAYPYPPLPPAGPPPMTRADPARRHRPRPPPPTPSPPSSPPPRFSVSPPPPRPRHTPPPFPTAGGGPPRSQSPSPPPSRLPTPASRRCRGTSGSATPTG